MGSESGTPFFVIEADEYDTAFFDKRSKFVHYHPRTAIFNNLEYDHADIFPDLAAIENQFHHLVRTVPAIGRLVVNGREASLRRVIERGCWSETEWFDGGPDDRDAWGMIAHPDGRFDVLFQGKLQGTVSWSPDRRAQSLECSRCHCCGTSHRCAAVTGDCIIGQFRQREASDGDSRCGPRDHGDR